MSKFVCDSVFESATSNREVSCVNDNQLCFDEQIVPTQPVYNIKINKIPYYKSTSF